MSTIQLREAAQWSKGLPHQNDAWNWLQNQISTSVLEEFALKYRNEERLQATNSQHVAPPQAIAIIKEFEGLSLTPYLCSAGVPTIGYGTTVYPNGKKVQLSDPAITTEKAEFCLTQTINHDIVYTLAKSVPFWLAMSNNQRAALISFAYNLGSGFMLAESGFNTLQKNLREKNWNAIPETLKLYRNPGTNSETGLLRRRVAEGELWKAEGRFAQ